MPTNSGYTGLTNAAVRRQMPGAVQTSMPITVDEAAMLARFNDGGFGTGFGPIQPVARDIRYASSPDPAAMRAVEAPANALLPAEVTPPNIPAVAPPLVPPVEVPSSAVQAVEVPQDDGVLPPVVVEQPGPGTDSPQGVSEEDLFLQNVPGVAAVPDGLPDAMTPEEAGLVAQFTGGAEMGAGFDVPQTAPQAGAPTLSATPDVGVETMVPEVPLPPLPRDEVFAQAWTNLIPSAKGAWSDFKQPIVHPRETFNAMRSLFKGVMQKFSEGEQAEEKYADAFGQFLLDRYGGWEEAKRTFANDPVGFLSDLSIIMTGGSSALAKLPGALGAVGKVTKAVGNAIDPLGRAGRVAIRGVGHLPLKQAKQYAQTAEEIWNPLSTIASQAGRVSNTLEP